MNFIKRTKIQYLHLPVQYIPAFEVKYRRLQYIRANGNCLFNTGISSVNGIDIKFKYNNAYSDTSIFGARNGDSSEDRFGLIIYNGGFHIMPPGWNVTSKDENIHTLTMGAYFNWQGTLDSIKWNMSSHRWSGNNMYLFGENGFSLVAKSYSNIYYCKLYRNNNLMRDYIPVKRRSDNAIGFYDYVSEQFYSVANSVAGPEV